MLISIYDNIVNKYRILSMKCLMLAIIIICNNNKHVLFLGFYSWFLPVVFWFLEIYVCLPEHTVLLSAPLLILFT